MSECKHGIEAEWCGTCTPPVDAGFGDTGMWFTARFDSKCSDCFNMILAGDRVLATDGLYLCTDCAPYPEPDLGGPFG